MSTPYSDIFDVFYSKVQVILSSGETIDDIIPPDLVKQFLKEASYVCYLELSLDLTLDDINEIIQEDLTKDQKMLLGNLMYELYLERENDKYKSIASAVGRDFQLTNMASVARNIRDTYEMIREKNREQIEKMKKIDFY